MLQEGCRAYSGPSIIAATPTSPADPDVDTMQERKSKSRRKRIASCGPVTYQGNVLGLRGLRECRVERGERRGAPLGQLEITGVIEGEAMTAREGQHRRFLQEKYSETLSCCRGATSEIEQVSP